MRIYISKKADIKFNIPVYEGKVRRFLESLIAVLCVIAVILLGVCIWLSSQFVSYTLEAGDTVSASDIVGDPDARFGDGQLATVVRPVGLDNVRFVQVRPPTSAFAAVYAAALPMGPNEDNAFASLPSVVRFADFASAGNTWDDTSSYRVWLPLAQEAKR